MGGPLETYEVTLPGGRVATMKLNEADARRYGVLDAPDTGPDTETPDTAGQTTETETPTKARTTRNKGRTATDKGGAGGGDD
ncbi:hypothetical protein ACH49_24330 [Streptomyces leeuwenhoekii]|uniref:ATP-grasp-modified RiPP n=1 Tax=Streptomyces leeuwenhoekii TaxID=1437453 RepID=A0ABR5HT81_STRLW|nr:hypothetical protein [Streptomyces leeuwenhoekii]KMS71757.1 hypothetical protein ACH49_24330 [Streptomyces leeuwenhoekii]